MAISKTKGFFSSATSFSFTVARLLGREAFNGLAIIVLAFAANCSSYPVSSFSLGVLDELALFCGTWYKVVNDRAFSLSFFRYFHAFTHYELFVSFRSLNFGCKINRINPLIVIMSSKLPAITNIIHKLLRVLQTIPNDN